MEELKNLLVEQSSKTPHVDLNQFNGELILSGKSIPENAAKIYEPILNWATEYVKDARQTTNLRLNLEYFNTASSLWLAKIIKTLTRINEPDYVLIIHLYIPLEDYDDIEEFGDIKDSFVPITDISQGALVSIGIKLYAINDNGEIIKDTFVFI
ncbi:MAG: DUF1987 domain-containing protein [Bacteroidales bacterium]|nr:DUF1987 domain-containing protein [Bacteroidales bacterium]